MRSGRLSILSMIVMLAIFGLILTAFSVYTARARDARCRRKCLTTLKCMAQSLKMYADDYDTVLPSSYLVNHSKRWNARDAAFFCTGAGYAEDPQATWRGARPKSWPQFLAETHLCPPYCFADSLSLHRRVSFYYKLANDKAWYAGHKRISDYGFEADQIAFYERLGFHSGDTSGLKDGVKINVSFIDTHVETITLRDATSGDPVDCAANTNGEPMYYNTRANERGGIENKQKGPATYTDPTCCYDDL